MPAKSKAQARALFAKGVITKKNTKEWLPDGMGKLPEKAKPRPKPKPKAKPKAKKSWQKRKTTSKR